MNKNEKLILVVKKNSLFKGDEFEGFMRPSVDFQSRILDNFEYIKREIAEKDENFKQPIGYAVIFNPKSKKLFAYQRDSDKNNYFESRLHGKWSLGIGGHIEKSEENFDNPVLAGLLREVSEEVNIPGKAKPELLGYINDDSDEVGKVHFGVLYLIKVDSDDVSIAGNEHKRGEMMSFSEFDNLLSDENVVVESWSKIAFNAIRNMDL